MLGVFLERGKRKIVWWLVWGALAYLMRMKMQISKVCLGYCNAQGRWDLRPVIYMFFNQGTWRQMCINEPKDVFVQHVTTVSRELGSGISNSVTTNSAPSNPDECA